MRESIFGLEILFVVIMSWIFTLGAQAQDLGPKFSDSRPSSSLNYALPGEDSPQPFIPAHPRSVAEQRLIESLHFYAVGRALEERREFAESILAYEKALASDPGSTSALRRLTRINFGLGRDEAGVAFGRRVAEVDPGDVETLELLVKHFSGEPAAVEILLKEVARNPKLVKGSVGSLYIELELGRLFESSLQIEKAAEAYAKVVSALDDTSHIKLTPAEHRRFLGSDEAQAYLRFGRVFLLAKRTGLAIQAFRRGLVYDPDEPALLLYLSQTYLETGQADDALAIVERFLKRQPRGRETYDLLAKILVTLKREVEVLPRLEAYAAADPKNVPLQYALAERYRLAGQPAKAQAIFNNLIAEQRETQEFADMFPKLLKERKTEDLLQLVTRVYARLKRFDAVQPQIELLVSDPVFTDEVVDMGLRMLASNPPALDLLEGSNVLIKICYEGKRLEKLALVLRASLRRLPSSFFVYQELIRTYYLLGKFDEAASVWKEMIEKFPDERNAKTLGLLAEVQSKNGKIAEAIASLREALALQPGDGDSIRSLADLYLAEGNVDQAVSLVRNAEKADPNNIIFGYYLSRILSKAGRQAEAIAHLHEMLLRFAGNDDFVKLAHSQLSIIYSQMNDFPKAEAELEMIFAKNPEDPGINNDLGYLYADQGKNLEKAEAMIRKAVAEEPENFAYLDSLGWVLFKRGKFQEARIPLEKAQADSRADSTIPDHLGDVYFQLQEPTKAKAAWERALKMASESKPVDLRVGEIKKKIESLHQFIPAPKLKNGNNP